MSRNGLIVLPKSSNNGIPLLAVLHPLSDPKVTLLSSFFDQCRRPRDAHRLVFCEDILKSFLGRLTGRWVMLLEKFDQLSNIFKCLVCALTKMLMDMHKTT